MPNSTPNNFLAGLGLDEVLRQFASSGTFHRRFREIFGDRYDLTNANILRDWWCAGDFSNLPRVEVVDDKVLGDASGAYAISTNTIYLSRGFLNTAAKETVKAAVLEEIGHWVDGYLNTRDSAGDEGEWFSNVVRGVNLSDAELSQIQSEDDFSLISLEGRSIRVEQSRPITLRVNITGDQGDGSAANGLSLRDAILIANANTTNQYIIELQGGQTYNVVVIRDGNDESDLNIGAGANITIRGVGTQQAIINGSGTDGRIFQVFGQANLTLDNVNVTRGQDGAIRVENGGILSVNNSSLTNNISRSLGKAKAGAIENFGTTIINDSLISNNQASSFWSIAGAIYNANVLEINGSTLSFNLADRLNSGGAISNSGTAYLTDSVISGNTADDGGGIYNNGTFHIANSTIRNNQSKFGGYGIKNDARMDLINSVITENRPSTDSRHSSIQGTIDNNGTLNIGQGSQIVSNTGNGIFNQYRLTIKDSSIASNTLDGIYSINFSSNTNPNFGAITATIINSLIQNNGEKGINNSQSTLISIGSTISGNRLGIYNSGLVTSINNTINNNLGTGVYNYRSLTLLQSLIDGNGRSGIYNGENGDAYIADSIIQNHHVTGDGGGIHNEEGTLSLESSLVQNNSATDQGGGIYSGEIDSSATLIIDDSVIKNNSAREGGGLYHYQSPLTIRNSLISNNRASDTGGGVYVSHRETGRRGVILNSTISENRAAFGGGILNLGIVKTSIVGGTTFTYDVPSNLAIINSTISSNNSTSSGGGIYNYPLGNLYLYNSTLTNNTSDSNNDGVGDGGGIYNQKGGGVRGQAVGFVEARNSIIAGNFDSPNNAGTGNIHPDVSGGSSVGAQNNLLGRTAGVQGTLGMGTDIVNANPILGTLQNNGGKLPTHTLLPGSPAINRGNNGFIPADTFDLDRDGNTTEPFPLDQRLSISHIFLNISNLCSTWLSRLG